MEIRRQLRHQQLLEHRGLDAQQRALLGDQPLVEHFHRGAHHGAGVHFAVAGLQAVEPALLDGELEILHFVVMRLQPVVQFHQLAVDVRHFLFQLGDRLGRADAGHHVLALRVDEVFAVNHVLAGAGIAREAHAGTGIAAHVAEHHRADVDRGAVRHVRRDLELPAVVDRALAHPGAEHRADRDFELFVRVLRKRLAGVALDEREKLRGQFLQMVRVEVEVEARAVLALDECHALVEMFVGDAKCDLAEELNEAAIGVVGKTRVVGLLDQPLQRGLVEAQVENGVHHARHRHRRAGAHRYEQRVVAAAKALAGLILQRAHVAPDVVHQAGRQLVFLEVGKTRVGGDRKPGRHVEPDLRHLAKVGALAAKEHLVLAVAFFEGVDVLLAGNNGEVRFGHGGRFFREWGNGLFADRRVPGGILLLRQNGKKESGQIKPRRFNSRPRESGRRRRDGGQFSNVASLIRQPATGKSN